MTAPVMSPQFRLQPIFLVQLKNRGGALVPHQRPGTITVFSACSDSAIRTCHKAGGYVAAQKDQGTKKACHQNR